MRWILILGLLGLAGVMVFIVGVPGRVTGAQNTDPVLARLENSPRHHEWVMFEASSGRKVRAFLTYPQVKERAAAVVVIHENRGLNDWARAVTDELAETGYLAIAPDLLSGKGPGGGGSDTFASSDAARTAIYQLQAGQIITDLKAALKFVKSLEACNGKVAVAGFCWGGGQSFRFATESDQLVGAFVFYGVTPRDDEALKRIHAPVFGFYGENDRRITGQIGATARRMNAAGKRYEPVVYKGAGHGFMRAGEYPRGGPANHAARQAAWKRWMNLLQEEIVR